MAYTTTAAVKRLLGISSTKADTLIGELIAEAKSHIDSVTGRDFGDIDNAAGTAATRKFTVGVDTDGPVLYLDDDLITITTVKTDADASTPVTVASTGYVTVPRNFGPYLEIHLLPDTNTDYVWDYTSNPQNGIEITGVWSFSLVPPDAIVRANNALAAHWYRQRERAETDLTVPESVERILSSYKKLVR